MIKTEVHNEVAKGLYTFARMQKCECKYTDTNNSFTIVGNLIRIRHRKENSTAFYSVEITYDTLMRYFTLLSYEDEDFLNDQEKIDREIGVLVKKFLDVAEIIMM